MNLSIHAILVVLTIELLPKLRVVIINRNEYFQSFKDCFMNKLTVKWNFEIGFFETNTVTDKMRESLIFYSLILGRQPETYCDVTFEKTHFYLNFRNSYLKLFSVKVALWQFFCCIVEHASINFVIQNRINFKAVCKNCKITFKL